MEFLKCRGLSLTKSTGNVKVFCPGNSFKYLGFEFCFPDYKRSLKKSISNDLVCEVATSESDWNTYYEALRSSGEMTKIIFISNPQIEALINAKDKVEAFKSLLDHQVKDN